MISNTYRTYSGRSINLLEPERAEITMIDIARGLSNTCRFGGQLPMFYSVAQHSVLVSMNVPEHLQLAALLHDAAEAYLGDVIRPLKYSGIMPGYAALEAHWLRAIGKHVGFDPDLCAHEKIVEADRRVLLTEKRDLRGDTSGVENALEEEIECSYLPDKALRLFLAYCVDNAACMTPRARDEVLSAWAHAIGE